MAPTKIKLI